MQPRHAWQKPRPKQNSDGHPIDVLGLALYATLGLALTAHFFS
jgi:hypothetical protein